MTGLINFWLMKLGYRD